MAWREQWGRRANDLEESGLSWRDAETQAFVEIWHQLRRDVRPADGVRPRLTATADLKASPGHALDGDGLISCSVG